MTAVIALDLGYGGVRFLNPAKFRFILPDTAVPA
eukprot:SAG31_NODE_8325_length_1474_cov_1.757818_1_plen_33_part_10